MGVASTQRPRTVGVACQRTLLPPPMDFLVLVLRRHEDWRCSRDHSECRLPCFLRDRGQQLPARRRAASLKILRNPTKCLSRYPDPCGRLLDNNAGRRSSSPRRQPLSRGFATVTTFNYQRPPSRVAGCCWDGSTQWEFEGIAQDDARSVLGSFIQLYR